MKTVVFAKSGKDMIKVLICFLIVGNAFIVLRGLITLRTLSALKLMSNENNSTNL